jgi:hypothetical protein
VVIKLKGTGQVSAADTSMDPDPAREPENVLVQGLLVDGAPLIDDWQRMASFNGFGRLMSAALRGTRWHKAQGRL